uniref:coiled-coil domain-containing protein 136-like isoform X2 n=1 Tax=Monopterus albus TaxID=43700 RepID=UPI0009B32F82|nr:coiled-coil domain-containing protein 136-like isoform X2 [Monopterus albus]
MELQGLLEEERLASAHQAETFTRQIQKLQAQLRSVQEEMDSLEEEKESELEEVQEELRSAQEEVLVLQQAAEEAAAERENDIASLQEELCRLRAELQRLHTMAQEYELEVTTLRAEISMKSQSAETYTYEEHLETKSGGSLSWCIPPSGCSPQVTMNRIRLGSGADDTIEQAGEMSHLEEELESLTDERHSLANDNEELSNKMMQLQQKRDMCDDVYLAVRAEGDTEREQGKKVTTTDRYITLSQCGPEHKGRPPEDGDLVSELNILKVQLREAEEAAHKVKRECDGLKGELVELQQLYDSSQQERAALEQELQHCRAELQKLVGWKSEADPGGWNLVVAAVAAAAIILLVIPSFTRA